MVRISLIALPALAAVIAAAGAARLLRGPYPIRLAGVLLVAGGTLWLCEQAARRLLPLSTLLRLSLVFPDQAPNRFRVALRAGSTRDLAAAARRPAPDGAQQAALHLVHLLAALARHDRPTRQHSERVRAYTDLLATAQRLPHQDRMRLRWAALVHDLGKLTLDPAVLGKPGGLDPDEWHRIRAHPREGSRLADGLREFLGPWFATIEQHHERWDGGGYPAALAGEQICLGARIVAVADSFEVMTAGRSYRAALTDAAARAELVRCSGTQFDPEVVRAMLDLSLNSVTRRGAPYALVAAAPFAGAPAAVGLGPGSALHPATHAHPGAAPSGHDAGGALHHTGHAHDGGASVPTDQR